MQFSTDTELENGDIVDIEDFEAHSIDELNAKLKEIWRSPNGVYEKLFCIELNADLFIDGECFTLPVYKFAVQNTDKPINKWVIEKWSEMFDAINGGRVEITEDQLTDYFGFNIPKSGDTIAWIEYLLFSPNCPERVLGKWLSEAEYVFDGEDEIEFGNLLIGNILILGKRHNKLNEMFKWLKSKDAKKFLLSDKSYEFAAKLILTQIELLDSNNLHSFVNQYSRPLDSELKLNETL